jgi:hypothetical protein
MSFLGPIVSILPDKVAAFIDYHFGRHRTFFPFGGPMNGQTARLEMVRSIIETCGIQQVIETGTFRGTTTEWFSEFEIPVLSAEIRPRYALFAQLRLRHRPNVQIECLDSISALRRWSEIFEITSKRTLFYLDAHWEHHLPLRHELELIHSKFGSGIVIVDDFKVPLDADYEFDDYGPGEVLEMDYIAKCNIGQASAFFPNVKGKWEAGRKRGCVVLTSDEGLAARCKALPLLRIATVQPQ